MASYLVAFMSDAAQPPRIDNCVVELPDGPLDEQTMVELTAKIISSTNTSSAPLLGLDRLLGSSEHPSGRQHFCYYLTFATLTTLNAGTINISYTSKSLIRDRPIVTLDDVREIEALLLSETSGDALRLLGCKPLQRPTPGCSPASARQSPGHTAHNGYGESAQSAGGRSHSTPPTAPGPLGGSSCLGIVLVCPVRLVEIRSARVAAVRPALDGIVKLLQRFADIMNDVLMLRRSGNNADRLAVWLHFPAFDCADGEHDGFGDCAVGLGQPFQLLHGHDVAVVVAGAAAAHHGVEGAAWDDVMFQRFCAQCLAEAFCGRFALGCRCLKVARAGFGPFQQGERCGAKNIIADDCGAGLF
ncbi:hypothetical protein JNJ66_07480 [Candidatus Saccharibacteria bacterium]|nr:hypothetical protein [Candidatus Saccharibacteria bacterium]